MTENEREESRENIKEEENEKNLPDAAVSEEAEDVEGLKKEKKETSELNDKYLRLYAEFENYKRHVAKEKEELIKYSNEKFMKELLSVIDHLELALHHSSNSEASTALAEGVEMTLKELRTSLEKFGLVSIEALGKPFDPSIHHAMTQVESEENEENTVVAEFRKGYMLKDRVLRAALVGISKKPAQKTEIEKTKEE